MLGARTGTLIPASARPLPQGYFQNTQHPRQGSPSQFLAGANPKLCQPEGSAEARWRERGLWEPAQQVVLVVRSPCGQRDCKARIEVSWLTGKGCCGKSRGERERASRMPKLRTGMSLTKRQEKASHSKVMFSECSTGGDITPGALERG